MTKFATFFLSSSVMLLCAAFAPSGEASTASASTSTSTSDTSDVDRDCWGDCVKQYCDDHGSWAYCVTQYGHRCERECAAQ